jgi:hypothetical protein
MILVSATDITYLAEPSSLAWLSSPSDSSAGDSSTLWRRVYPTVPHSSLLAERANSKTREWQSSDLDTVGTFENSRKGSEVELDGHLAHWNIDVVGGLRNQQSLLV